MQHCSSCQSIFTKVPSASCPACTHGDYSDYFSASTDVVEISHTEMLADGAEVTMCPKCIIYIRKLPNSTEVITMDNTSGMITHCPACDCEMVKVRGVSNGA